MKRLKGVKEVDTNVTIEKMEVTPPKKDIRYNKLVVPTRMRSIYWKYFGFPANQDGLIITKDVIICILCKNQMIYNRNTSNLKVHLTSKHKGVAKRLESLESEKLDESNSSEISGAQSKEFDVSFEYPKIETIDIPVPKLEDMRDMITEELGENDVSNFAFIVNENNQMIQYEREIVPEESIESIEINDATVNFIVTDLVSPDIVEGRGFRSLISHLTNRTLVMPNEKKLVDDILPTLYKAYKDQLLNTFSSNCITNMSLSLEGWVCADNRKCLSVNIHYLQNSEPVLQTKLLTTVCCTGFETVHHWNTFLDSLFEDWNISCNSISAVLVAFDIEELKEALVMKNVVLLPCFLHVLQKVCGDCFQHADVAKTLAKCRALIRNIQDGKIILEDDWNESMNVDGEENDIQFPLSLDCPDLWLTTFYMLRNLTAKKKAISESVRNKNIQNSLTSHEWKIVKDLSNLLEPFKTVIFTLFEEKSSLISLLKPLIWKVSTTEFQAAGQDSAIIKQLKVKIKNALNEAYADENAHHFVQIASMLDPRFKGLTQQDEILNYESNLKDVFNEFLQSEGLHSQLENHESRKRNSSGINVIFGAVKVNDTVLSIGEKAAVEIAQYQAEDNARLDECPLEWWQNMNNKCPNLSRLALNYHCVPAVVVVSSNRLVKDYINFYYRRSVLKSSIADALLFLHVNKCIDI